MSGGGGSGGTTRTCNDDGHTDPPEECDDGNDVSTDSCASCVLARCGDGVVWQGFEQCDLGSENGTPGSGCGIDCSFIDCDGPCDPLWSSAECHATCDGQLCGISACAVVGISTCDGAHGDMCRARCLIKVATCGMIMAYPDGQAAQPLRDCVSACGLL